MPSAAFYREIAAYVIKEHMSKGECLFSPTAVEDICKAALLAAQTSKDSIMDALHDAVLKSEIYCPHEGIDRRAEYGLAPVL